MKNKRKTPIAIKIVLAIAVVVMALIGGLFLKIKYEQSIMSPLDTMEVASGVYAINNGFVNIFLLQAGDEYLMIDAGDDISQTEAALDKLAISADAIKAILLTHSDSDHVAALSLFPDAIVYLPALEVQMIDGTTRRSIIGNNSLDREYVMLNDGDEISLLELSVQCISTPGHTPGSMSFLVDERYLFVGDTMGLNAGNASTFNAAFNMDSDMQRDSIRELAERVQPGYIFTAHYGYSSNVDTVFKGWH